MALNETVFGGIIGVIFILSILASPIENIKISDNEVVLEIDRDNAKIRIDGTIQNLYVEQFLKNGFISTWRVIYTLPKETNLKLIVPYDIIVTYSNQVCVSIGKIDKKVLFGSISYNLCEITNATGTLIIEYSSGF